MGEEHDKVHGEKITVHRRTHRHACGRKIDKFLYNVELWSSVLFESEVSSDELLLVLGRLGAHGGAIG